MTMLSELALSRARIASARENSAEFGDVFSRYLDQRPAELKVSIDEQGRGAIRVACRKPIAVQLPILLGESLQICAPAWITAFTP